MLGAGRRWLRRAAGLTFAAGLVASTTLGAAAGAAVGAGLRELGRTRHRRGEFEDEEFRRRFREFRRRMGHAFEVWRDPLPEERGGSEGYRPSIEPEDDV
ncbi:MAG: hypothetical protein QJR14_05085 [Bacillota bacterium]|nr:hypothetical protein [Bacillota bacterium]